MWSTAGISGNAGGNTDNAVSALNADNDVYTINVVTAGKDNDSDAGNTGTAIASWPSMPAIRAMRDLPAVKALPSI